MSKMTAGKSCTLQACKDAFRGYGKILSESTSGKNWSVLLDIHGTKVNIAHRQDGVLFVNCAGRTALLTPSVLALRRALPAVLRK